MDTIYFYYKIYQCLEIFENKNYKFLNHYRFINIIGIL